MQVRGNAQRRNAIAARLIQHAEHDDGVAARVAAIGAAKLHSLRGTMLRCTTARPQRH